MELSRETVLAILERELGDIGAWDYADTYGEPGYRIYGSADTETGMVILANYWCQCGKVREEAPEHLRDTAEHRRAWNVAEDGTRPKLHTYDYHHPRVWAQLEAQGVMFEWYDEWLVDWEATPSKAYRTEADSYSWQRSVIVTEEGFLLTPDTDIAEWIAWAQNDYTRCITVDSVTAQLPAQGFTEFSCDYESGWYGRDDSPEAITDAIRRDHPGATIVFALSGVEQFRITFCAYYRAEGEEE